MRDEDGEDGEHHDTHRHEEEGDEASHGSDGNDVGADGGDVHAGPPECLGVGVEVGVDVQLGVVEHQTDEVDGGGKDGEVAIEEGGGATAREAAYQQGQGISATHQGGEANQVTPVVRQLPMGESQDGEVGDGDEQEEEVRAEVVPLSRSFSPLPKEVEQEEQTDPALEVEELYLSVIGDAVEGVDGDINDEQEGEE